MTPRPLRGLIAKLLVLILRRTGQLERGGLTVLAWRDELAQGLARYHQAAYLAGQGGGTLSEPARQVVARLVQAQLDFLDNFALQLQSAAEWQKRYNARAALYAGSIKVPYWIGRTRMLPLPFMPAQGTQCGNNCGCAWRVEQLEGEGNYDCYWERGKTDSCQTCVARERGNPYRIREGMLR